MAQAKHLGSTRSQSVQTGVILTSINSKKASIDYVVRLSD